MAPNSSTNSIIHLTATSHFPIKLTSSNFPVWRKQVFSTLIGLGLESFIDNSISPPPKYTTDNPQKPNPDYTTWFRQDQILLGALLGSCSDAIQPTLASATTASNAWQRLTTSYASTSRSRIISLKSKLAKNPKGYRPIADYLTDMRAIADELALAQSPVDEEDLMVHIINQLGDEFSSAVAALKIRDTPISYPALFDKLVDFERSIKENDIPASASVITANYTQKQSNRGSNKNSNSDAFSRTTRSNSNGQSRNNRVSNGSGNSYRTNYSQPFCYYCNFAGHETRDCRKLARFLKDNNITINSAPAPAPVINATTSRPNSASPAWIFDSGASHHVASDRSSLHNISEYGGPDEIILGDGSSNGNATHAG